MICSGIFPGGRRELICFRIFSEVRGEPICFRIFSGVRGELRVSGRRKLQLELVAEKRGAHPAD